MRGTWFPWILESFAVMTNAGALRSFGIMTETPLTAQTGGLEAWQLEEQKRLTSFFDLLVELASARAWSQILFSTLVPNSLSGVLSMNAAARKTALKYLKETWDAVLAAEDFVQRKDKANAALRMQVKGKLAELAWNQLQLAREIYAVCALDDWKADGPNVQAMARALFQGPANTKYDLEDAFAHLASVSKTTTQSTAMNKRLAYEAHTCFCLALRHMKGMKLL